MAPVETPQMISTVKLPMLKKGEYTLWSMRMEQYLTNTYYGLWQVIMNGDEPVQTTKDKNGVETEVPPKTTQALLQRQKERKAKSIMLLAIPDEYQLRFHTIKDAKSLWAAIKSRFGGNVESKKMQKNVLKQQFENFFVSDTEGLDKAYDRFQKLISQLEIHDELDINDLYNNLKVFEVDIKGSSRSSSNSQNVAFISAEDTNSINEVNTANGVYTIVGHSSQGQASSSSYTNDLIRGHFTRECKAPRNQWNKNGDTGYMSRDNNRRTVPVETSNALVVQDNALIMQDRLGYDWSYIAQDEQRVASHSLHFKLLRSDQRLYLEIIAYQLGLESVKAQLVVHQKNEGVYEEKIAVLEFEVKDKVSEMPRVESVRPSGVIIEDWVSDDEEDIFQYEDCQTTIKPSFKRIEFTKAMNEPVKSDKQVVKPRMVTQSPKKMPKESVLRKGAGHKEVRPIWNNTQRINHQNKFVPTVVLTRVSKVNFNIVRVNGVNTAGQTAVSTVKGNGVTAVKASAGCVWRPKMTDLNNGSKDNSGSEFKKRDPQQSFKYKDCFVALVKVLEVKNNILFTETECHVLSPDFKLIDESQVLLRVPRQNNMYSFDLKNVVPSGDLTCLFAKATIDESKLWHRRLGHVNFKIINKLVKGNLVRCLPSKTFENDHTCVACQKGKQHKASCTGSNLCVHQPTFMLLHWTYWTNIWIKREYSVARTPQQNGVAKRKNRTLIEVARTMLVDSLLPTVFWAEFDGKDEEGFFVGFSINSRLFRREATEQSDAVRKSLKLVTFSLVGPSSGPSFVPFGESFPIDAANLPHDPLMPKLEDTTEIQSIGFFGNAYDDHDLETLNTPYADQNVGAEANFNNMEPFTVFKIQKVWTIVDLPSGKKAIGTKWMFKVLFSMVPLKRRYMFANLQYESLSTYLLDNGFHKGQIDKTLFIKRLKGDILLVQVYVDDIIFSSTKKSLCDEFEQIMHNRLQMSSMGELTFFFSLQVKQKEDGIFISQDKYVGEILKKFGFSSVRTASTPMETNKALTKDEDGEDVDVYLYKSMIGSLMSTQLGLWYPKDSPLILEAFSDSDYAGASLDRKSTTGGCQFLGSRKKRFWDTKIPQSGGPPIKVVMRLSIRSWVKEWKGLPLMLLAFEAEQDNRTPTILPSIQITHEAEETATMPHDSPLPGGHTPGSDEGRMQHTKLMELITKLTHRIEALEKDLQQTKKTYSTALTKLVLKVKKLEKQVRSGKAKRRDRIVLLEDEDVEDIETQEKNSADTEVLLKEATPTELIEDLGSGEKGKKEISIADVPISTAGAEVSTTSHDVSTASQKTLVLLLRRSAQRQRTRKGSIKEGSSGEQEKAMAEQGSKKDLFEAALELQKYHALQNRPYSVAEVRKNMVMYLKNQAGYKQSYFKGMKYEEIRPIFEKVWDQTHTFVPMDSEDKEKDSEKKGSRQKITGRKKRQ
ncbi:putative ribonuclease H-like domain-containing protein [Tanacetum coccineum]